MSRACAWELAKSRANERNLECVGVRFDDVDDDGAAKGLTGFSRAVSLSLS